MRYWPYTVIAWSPLLSPPYRAELMRVNSASTLSDGLMLACCQCANETPTRSVPLAITYDINGRARFVYLERPTYEDWARLERGIFIQADGEFGFVVDALH